MQFTKRLFLGSAAALVAVAGAQAADLPVKAKPVQYVNICSLYGDGFYYIPGSDTCLKIGGYVRADYGYNNHTNTPQYSGDAGANDRNPNRHPFTMRHRLNWTADARTQTPYGTLRAFTSMHAENRHLSSANDVGQDQIVTHRAFIQWAGFTFGHTQSFVDPAGTIEAGMRTLHSIQTESSTDAAGVNQISYAWTVGNGVTLNVGADERRVQSVWNATTPGTRIGGGPATSRTGQWEPSPWVALRVNQGWGAASIAVIGQNTRAQYYTGGPGCPVGAQVNTTECDHPNDKWAFGILSGAEIKLPMFGPGDRVAFQVNYSQGAVRFAAQNLSSPSLFRGREVAFGFVSDAVYVNGTTVPGQLSLTTAWSASAGYEHFWTPNFSSTLFGGYVDVSYNDTVIANRSFCSATQVQTAGACDPGFALWHIGSHVNWFPAAGFRLAAEVMYTGIETAMAGPITLGQARGLRPTGAYTARDKGVTSVMFRAQRNWN